VKIRQTVTKMRKLLTIIVTLVLLKLAFSQSVEANNPDLQVNAMDWVKYSQLIGLTVSGMAIFTLWKIKEHIRTFNFQTLWSDMKFIWLWVFLFSALIEAALLIVPNIDAAFNQLLGLNIVHSAAGALTLGFTLTASFYEKPKRDNDGVVSTVED
jgi:hypothetical protein